MRTGAPPRPCGPCLWCPGPPPIPTRRGQATPCRPGRAAPPFLSSRPIWRSSRRVPRCPLLTVARQAIPAEEGCSASIGGPLSKKRKEGRPRGVFSQKRNSRGGHMSRQLLLWASALLLGTSAPAYAQAPPHVHGSDSDADAGVPFHQAHPMDPSPPTPTGKMLSLPLAGGASAVAYVAQPKQAASGGIL